MTFVKESGKENVEGIYLFINNYSLLLDSCLRPSAGKGSRLSRFFEKIGIVAFKSSPEREKNLSTAFYRFPKKTLFSLVLLY